ncbi:MAG: threonylcarbamoyl-AMP synthase [Flammeovirgaceae bacterium]|nr:MAG: threonylcarbamoyl-AMP synthase [Flammeovirgaceae bacterium]
MAEIGTHIEKAAQLLRAGELVAIPTETVYGLAGNALNPKAVAKIFETKNRPHFNPLIVHVPDGTTAKSYVQQFPEPAEKLARAFWPGPLTLVLKKKPIIPDLVTAGFDTVGLRCPDHPLTHTLLSQLAFPLAAPSANLFGRVSPTKPEHVNEQLGQRIPYILDGGSCVVGIESTIVGFEEDQPVVYRLGGITIEQIRQVVGEVFIKTNGTKNPRTPGQLKSHYAPSKKIILGKIEELLQRYPAHCSGILTLSKDFNSPHQRMLSPTGNLHEAAHNLFQALRDFETMPVDVILAELVEEQGLGRAINDRLRRAAATEP